MASVKLRVLKIDGKLYVRTDDVIEYLVEKASDLQTKGGGMVFQAAVTSLLGAATRLRQIFREWDDKPNTATATKL